MRLKLISLRGGSFIPSVGAKIAVIFSPYRAPVIGDDAVFISSVGAKIAVSAGRNCRSLSYSLDWSRDR